MCDIFHVALNARVCDCVQTRICTDYEWALKVSAGVSVLVRCLTGALCYVPLSPRVAHIWRVINI